MATGHRHTEWLFDCLSSSGTVCWSNRLSHTGSQRLIRQSASRFLPAPAVIRNINNRIGINVNLFFKIRFRESNRRPADPRPANWKFFHVGISVRKECRWTYKQRTIHHAPSEPLVFFYRLGCLLHTCRDPHVSTGRVSDEFFPEWSIVGTDPPVCTTFPLP